MSRHSHRVVLLLVALVVLGGLPTVATAQQFGPGGSDGAVGGVVRIDAGETYDGNLDAAAGSVVVAGTVEGDVSAAAGSVVVTDSGRVTGSLDAAAGSVVVEGVVEGDVTVGAAALELREGSRVGGDLEAGAADVRLDGAVEGDVTAGADTLVVGPSASIGGSLTYDAETVSIADDAAVSGAIVRDESLSVAEPEVFGAAGSLSLPPIPAWVGAIYAGLVNLLLGAVLLAAAPDFARRLVAAGTTATLRSAGVGLLAFVGIPILLLLLLATIVGIPLSLAGLVVFALLLWVTTVYGMIVVGTMLLSLLDTENRWLALVVGVVAVSVLGAIPVVGGLVQFAVLLVGFGAFVLALRGRGDSSDGDSGPAVGGVAAE
ncbi:polymer-forming cytoskeletal protein [Halobellus sp. GM3]|uniref:polymer-forming cytoskeletal protein n=1 Tax=Halobellus sp. GM3 TaxID=3458410 RepID=UPI00403D9A21